MTTPAHDNFDSTKPDGATSPTTYSSDNLKSLRALRDMVITGQVQGFVQSRTQGTGPDVSRPQYITWLNSSLGIGFRMVSVWGGTGNFRQTSIEWDWSNDSGSTWTQMGSTQANTFDSNDNITASTNSGGFFTLVAEIWTKVLRDVSNLAAHIGLVTTDGVHGLGNIASQDAGAVALTGGAIDNTAIGQTTPEKVRAKRVSETFVDLGSIPAAGTAPMDLSAGSHFAFAPNSTPSATITVAVSNPPASGQSQDFLFEIVNGQRSDDAKITWPASFHWVGGSSQRPADTALEASGRNLFHAVTRDGGTTYDVQHAGKRG